MITVWRLFIRPVSLYQSLSPPLGTNLPKNRISHSFGRLFPPPRPDVPSRLWSSFSGLWFFKTPAVAKAQGPLSPLSLFNLSCVPHSEQYPDQTRRFPAWSKYFSRPCSVSYTCNGTARHARLLASTCFSEPPPFLTPPPGY